MLIITYNIQSKYYFLTKKKVSIPSLIRIMIVEYVCKTNIKKWKCQNIVYLCVPYNNDVRRVIGIWELAAYSRVEGTRITEPFHRGKYLDQKTSLTPPPVIEMSSEVRNVRGHVIDFASFCNFSIGLWKSSHCMIFPCFLFYFLNNFKTE